MTSAWHCSHGPNCSRCAQLDAHIRAGEERDSRELQRDLDRK